MRVHGERITEAQIAACVKAMTGKFEFMHVFGALRRADVKHADRATDRLLQREKKAGRIVYTGGCWTKQETRK